MRIRSMVLADYQEVDRLMAQVHRLHVEGRPDLYIDVEHIYSFEQFKEMVENEDMITFHIRDYGIGIPPDRMESLFDGTAYTGNSSSDSSRGMGIGLSICKTIITAHKGRIDVTNCDKGSDFYFSLPRSDEGMKK